MHSLLLPGNSRFANDHKCTVLSFDPEAKYWQSGDIATVEMYLKKELLFIHVGAPKLVLISMEDILLGNIYDSFHSETTSSDRNYGQSSVMTNQISNLTKQSFPEIRRNDQSLNETIWTPKCDKLHVLDMIEKMKRKKFVHWIFSLHATKFYEAKVNPFCKGKLLIKINIVKHSFNKNLSVRFFLVFENNTFFLTVYKKFFSGEKGNQSSISR